jgi:hypothetical protein
MPELRGENMKKFKSIRMTVRKTDGDYLLAPWLRPQGGLITTFDVVATNDFPNEGRDYEAVRHDALLLKDMEETNRWARSGFRMFFGWFAWQFTVNVVATGWLIAYKGPVPALARLVYALFIGWNLLGTIGTLLIHKSLHDCDLRIKKVIETLTQEHWAGEICWKPQSAVPLQAINTVFIFCAVTTFTSMAFWTIVFVTQGR